MATPKEELNAILSAAGAPDFASATEQINTWKASAGQASQWQSEISEIYALAGASDHAGAIAGITGMRNSINALWSELGVGDQEGAMNAIRTWKTDLTAANGRVAEFEGRIAELQESQKDFDAAVGSAVIKQAASAGLPTPIAKGIADESTQSSKTLSRAEFNVLNATEQRAFSLAGGKLTDE